MNLQSSSTSRYQECEGGKSAVVGLEQGGKVSRYTSRGEDGLAVTGAVLSLHR